MEWRGQVCIRRGVRRERLPAREAGSGGVRAAAHNAGPPCALHGSPSLGSTSEGEQVFVSSHSSSPSSMMVSSLPQLERAASAFSPDWLSPSRSPPLATPNLGARAPSVHEYSWGGSGPASYPHLCLAAPWSRGSGAPSAPSPGLLVRIDDSSPHRKRGRRERRPCKCVGSTRGVN